MLHNSSNGFAPALRIEPRPSRRLTLYLVAGHTLAASVWLLQPLSLPPMLLGLLLLGISLVHDWRLHVRATHPCSIHLLEYHDEYGWRLTLADGGRRTLVLRAPVFVTRHLVIAGFGKGLWPHCRLVLAADAVDARRFRHLRVRLLQSAHGHRDRTQIPGAR